MPIYLDYNATTPVAPEVLDAMLPYLREHFGNPSSSHVYGERAAAAIQAARRQVAELIGASPDEVVFTGCATEANNLAIRGAASALRTKGRHLITSAVEHPSVAAPFQRLAREGWEVTVLPVDGYGQVAPEALERAIRPDTVLVSVMHANNEVGTLQPVSELAPIARTRGVLFHTDAAQSVGKVPVNVDELDVDLLTLAGHKFYAPKGVGALFVRRGTPIEPLLVGAGHERGLRPGTENVAYIAGMGAAADLVTSKGNAGYGQLRQRRDLLHRLLEERIPDLILNGHPAERLPNTLNVSFPDITGAQLLEAAPGIAASTGSACHSGDAAPSGVLGQMGASSAVAAGAVRLSVGAMTTESDIEQAAAELLAAYRRLLSGGEM